MIPADSPGRDYVDVHLPDWLFDVLADPDGDRRSALLEFANETMNTWGRLLEGYLQHDRGSISEGTLSADNIDQDESGAWYLECSFEEFEAAGCSDLEVNDDRDESLDLEIDTPNRRIRFVGAMITPPRIPDDEL